MISEAYDNPPTANDDFAFSQRELSRLRGYKVDANVAPQVCDFFASTAIATVNANAEKPTQVGGAHYSKLAIDPYTYGTANNLDPYQFNAIKYVTRFRDKGGIEDLRKAIDTIEKLIAYEQGKK